MGRTFKLEKRLAQNAAGGVLDVPQFALLRYKTPKQFVDDFKATWTVPPESVVLPAVAHDGLLFRVAGLDDQLSAYSRVSDELRDFQSVVRAFADLGLDIYVLLQPRLAFVQSESLHVEDIIGQGSPVLCVGNPRSQEALAAILGTAIDLVLDTTGSQRGGKLKGVVIDVVNLWGMGGRNKRIHPTCFCPSCRNYFNVAAPGLLQHFQDFPNPWNLLLRATDSGIDYVDDIGKDAKDDDIIGWSRQRGLSEVFDDKSIANLRRQSELLRQYIRVRHDQTLAAIDEILKQAFGDISNPPTRVLLMEGVNYGWTSGLQLDRLDSVGERQQAAPYDEVWFDPSSADLFLRHVPFRSYMWARGRYFIDAFFDFAADVSNPRLMAITGISRYTSVKLGGILRSRLNKALGTAMTGLTSLASLPDLVSGKSESKRLGFVGVGLERAMGESFIEGVMISEGAKEERHGEEEEALPPDMAQLMRLLLSQKPRPEEEEG